MTARPPAAAPRPPLLASEVTRAIDELGALATAVAVVWAADLDWLEAAAGGISPGRLAPVEAKAARARRPGLVRDRFVARRLLRRAVLAAHGGCEAEAIEVAAHCAVCGSTAHGKPALQRPAALAGRLHFSASSTEGLAAVAVADSPLGLDVEARRGPAPGLAAMGRAAGPALALVAESLPAGAGALEVWTAFEALAKAAGLGLAAAAGDLAAALGRWRPCGLVLGGAVGCVALPAGAACGDPLVVHLPARRRAVGSPRE